MKLAYQTNTWGGVVGHPAGVTSVKDLYYLTPGSTEQALQDIAAAGYTGFELFDGNLMQYTGRETAFRDLMGNHGLQFVGVYSGANFIYGEIREEELSKIEGVVEFAAKLGAIHLVVGGGAIRATGTREEDYQRLGEGLERVVEIANRAGLTPHYHPHLGTIATSPEQIAKIFQHTSINFCPDTAHLQAGGGDPAELIRTYADRVKYVHLKDYRDGAFLPLGEGTQNLDEILSTLRDMQYDGWTLVELDAWESPIAGARISKAFLDARAR
ncbi:MAG: sugar phosphate isomerase/epimerase [Chloroflexota bacterium]|nr:sugar phosphate isomerase/epimerase [Chloroflexota bacterium]